MGSGYKFKCSKCRNQYSVSTGTGFIFPDIYTDMVSDIKEGKYGDEWKELMLSEEFVAVDAERNLYVCKECGYWTVDSDLSLYAPNDPDLIRNKQYGIKTVEEWGEVPYVMGGDLRDDYHLLKKWIHKCEKCGSVMHKGTEEEKENLPCPKCGGKPKTESTMYFMWD